VTHYDSPDGLGKAPKPERPERPKPPAHEYVPATGFPVLVDGETVYLRNESSAEGVGILTDAEGNRYRGIGKGRAERIVASPAR